MAANEIPVAGYKSKLLSRVEVAEGTMVFYFAKPTGFIFKAGQFADVTLTDAPDTDAEGNIRTFSIATPPFEDELTFTTRMRDTAFKRSASRRCGFPGDSAGVGDDQSKEMLLRHLDNLMGPIYYIAAPPAMVSAMRQKLTRAGLDEDYIRTEEFLATEMLEEVTCRGLTPPDN